MIVCLASFKNGVGKSTPALHLCAYYAQKGSTLLVDGDPNRSVTQWAKQGSLPFKVVDERMAVRYAKDHEYIVIDTQARPTEEDLQALVEASDYLIIPATPDALSLHALSLTVAALRTLNVEQYGILLTMVPPKPSKDGLEAQLMLRDAGLPVLHNMVRRFVAFQKAALAGVPVYEAKDPRAEEAWQEYVCVGEEVLQHAQK